MANVPQVASFDASKAASMLDTINQMGDRMDQGRVQFLKFKKGDWIYGRNEDTFPENGFEGIPNLPEIKYGWVCWKDGTLGDEFWVSISETLPDKSTLTDHGPYSQENDGWQQNVRFDIKILATKGVPETIMAQFTASSRGAQSATGSLLKQWARDGKEGKHLDKAPVVLFGADFYKHKSFGRVDIPTMEIVRYVDLQDADSKDSAVDNQDTDGQTFDGPNTGISLEE